jgi:transposase
MRNKKHKVDLSPEARENLLALISKGCHKASVIRRAHILLKTDEGKTDAAISEVLYISEQTVRRIRLRYIEEGLESALQDKAHPDRGLKLDGEKEAYLIALACSDPPSGQKRWTLELLADQLVSDGIVRQIAPETVRLTLKKTVSNLGK